MLAATQQTTSALKHWDIVGHVQHRRGGLGEERTFLVQRQHRLSVRGSSLKRCLSEHKVSQKAVYLSLLVHQLEAHPGWL